MSTAATLPVSEKTQARFWAKVALPDGNGCMLWMGAKQLNGYGRFKAEDKSVLSHRFSYELAYGPIPEGMVLDHVRTRGCVNRHCVAPAHLEAVTQRENLLRGKTLPAANAGVTHCPQGHPYAGENVHDRTRGSRECRSCGRSRAQRKRDKSAAA